MKKIEKFVEKNYRIVLIVLFVFAFVTRVNHFLVEPSISGDQCGQHVSSNSLAIGKKITIPETDLNDLSKINYVPYNLFPSGFSILLVPILKITNNNFLIASGIIYTIFMFLLLFGILKILLLFKDKFNILFIPLLLLFWAFSYQSPMAYVGQTDVISFSFFILALYYFFKVLMIGCYCEKEGIIYAALITLFSFLGAFFRYAYYPLAFLLPSLLLLIGIILKEKKYKSGLFSFVIICIVMFAFLYLQKMFLFDNTSVNSLSNSYIKSDRLYWENLSTYNSVFLYSFTSEMFFNSVTKRISIDEDTIFALKTLLSSVIFIIICFGLISFIKKNSIKNIKVLFTSKTNILFFTLILIMIYNTLFLTILSVLYSSFAVEKNVIASWVTLPRYFAINFTFIQIILLGIVFLKNSVVSKIYKRIVFLIFATSILINMFYTIAFFPVFNIFNPSSYNADEKPKTDRELLRTQFYEYYLLKNELDKINYRKIIVDGHYIDTKLVGIPLTSKNTSIIDANDLLTSKLFTSEPVDIFFPVVNKTNKTYVDEQTHNQKISSYLNFIINYNGKMFMKLKYLDIDIYVIRLSA